MGFRLLWGTGYTVALTMSLLTVGSTLAQTKPQKSELRPFIGTWTAVHDGTPIIVLHLSSEKGDLVGGIQVCSYRVNTETSGTIDLVTNPTLSKTLPIKNIKVSGNSMSFDWTDPDGDNDHWRLELSGEKDGRIVWEDLPSDVKVLPIPVSKNIPKLPESRSPVLGKIF